MTPPPRPRVPQRRTHRSTDGAHKRATRTPSGRLEHRSAALAVTAVIIGMVGLTAPATAAEPQFTPVAASVLAPLQPVRATDGRVHLVYELTLFSVEAVPVEVQVLDVRAAGPSRPVSAGPSSSTLCYRAAAACRARSRIASAYARTSPRPSGRTR